MHELKNRPTRVAPAGFTLIFSTKKFDAVITDHLRGLGQDIDPKNLEQALASVDLDPQVLEQALDQALSITELSDLQPKGGRPVAIYIAEGDQLVDLSGSLERFNKRPVVTAAVVDRLVMAERQKYILRHVVAEYAGHDGDLADMARKLGLERSELVAGLCERREELGEQARSDWAFAARLGAALGAIPIHELAGYGPELRELFYAIPFAGRCALVAVVHRHQGGAGVVAWNHIFG